MYPTVTRVFGFKPVASLAEQRDLTAISGGADLPED